MSFTGWLKSLFRGPRAATPESDDAEARPSHVWDVLALCGVLMVVGGVAAVYWPAALVLAGGVLVTVAVLGAKRWS